MPILILIVIGAAAGFLATRFMRVQTDVPTTIAIGVGGALLGWLILRFLVSITGWVAAFVGAVIGAMALIWLWQKYIGR
ncbi:MAG: GlsB/YeaQ/YmgE family stress response membrane protein [Paracoccaceae bacterium]